MEPLGELAKDGETKVAQEVKSGALKKRGGEGEDSISTSVKPVERSPSSNPTVGSHLSPLSEVQQFMKTSVRYMESTKVMCTHTRKRTACIN